MPYSRIISKKSLFETSSTAWPMALNAVLLQSVTIIDLLLIAALGEVSVAAFGIAIAIIAFILGVQLAIANGIQIILSRAVGADNIEKVGMGVTSGCLINMGFSIFTIFILFFGAEPIINAITDNHDVAAQTISYIKVSLLLLICSSISQVIIVYFNAYKKTRIPLYGFMLEIPFNVICSATLIYGLWGAPEMGLIGAAWGSVFATCIRFTYLAYQFNRDRRKGNVTKLFFIDSVVLKRHFNEVMPVVSNFTVLLSGQMMFTILFAQLPVSAFAAITLVLPWIKILSMFANAWVQSSAITVSQYIGKENFRSIPEFVTQSHLVSFLLSIIMVLGFFIFSKIIPFLYTDLSNETIIALSIIAPAYIFIPIFNVNNMFCGNMMRAMGEGYRIVRIHVITLWLIALPTCALLIFIKAPLFIVFSVILFDEILKFFPFRETLDAKLTAINHRKKTTFFTE